MRELDNSMRVPLDTDGRTRVVVDGAASAAVVAFETPNCANPVAVDTSRGSYTVCLITSNQDYLTAASGEVAVSGEAWVLEWASAWVPALL